MENAKNQNKKTGKRSRPQYVSLKDFIDTTIPCKNGRFCEKEDCRFLHNIKTRMCKFEQQCRRKNCNFAHAKSELYVAECKFGPKCNNENCGFKHVDPVVWKYEEIHTVNDENNLKRSATNFPVTLKVNLKNRKKNIINYGEMKKIIENADTVVIEQDDIGKMLDEYECVLNYKKITFKF